MASSANNNNNASYQHTYQKVDIHNEEDRHVKESDASSRGLLGRGRIIKICTAAVVLLIVWFVFRNHREQSSEHPADTPSSCASWPVVVDNTGIIEDGPGSKGICDDPVHWYDDQLIDHFNNDGSNKNKWTQKYFINDDYFQGPGYPIFMIMGGEDEANCLFYPFVTHTLARIFGGMTLEAEHRFYGKSQPIELEDVRDMIGLLTPEQAMADYLRLLKSKQEAYGCSTNRHSPDYCPIITVGASYPGFLAAMMRLVHGDIVDMAYASSAPLPLYAQTVDPDAYFDKVTEAANTASPGCSMAVKTALLELKADVLQSDQDVGQIATRMGICADGDAMPEYITTLAMLWHELETTVAANFADFNMANYPPSPYSDTNRACTAFQDNGLDAYGKIQQFWHVLATSVFADEGKSNSDCFDFHSQIPDGPHGSVTSADWTGGGDGKSGLSWDFQTCTDLVVQAGFGRLSMFPKRSWTLDGLTKHCQSRFGVDPTPTRMVDQWHFDDLVGQNATRILFTNGLNDGWAADSILDDLGPDLITINMPNGAHHSDLNHRGPNSDDTDDVRDSYPLILHAITRWLTEVKAEMHQGEECH